MRLGNIMHPALCRLHDCRFYIDVPGLSRPETLVEVKNSEDSLSVRVTVPPPEDAPAGALPVAHVLRVGPLYGSIKAGEGGVTQRVKGETLTVTVAKAVEATWWSLKQTAPGGGAYGGDYAFDDEF